MIKQPTLETRRLILRPFALTDARHVQRLAGERAIADTTLNVPHPYEDGQAEEWIASLTPKREAGERVVFAVVLKSTQDLIGSIGLRIKPRFQRAELGYWIGKPYWNHGYCTEAARAILEYGFNELRLNRIHASYLSRNPASARVMQKLGMTYEGRARQHIIKWDKFEDVEFYGIVKEDWGKSREKR